jgi:hypothetical protein
MGNTSGVLGRSKRIEAHRAFIVKTVVDRKDITLAELQGRLAWRGARFGISTHALALLRPPRNHVKKKDGARMPPSSNTPVF